jgi:hypothetical protein
MNGKTHQISGVATVLAASWLTLEHRVWLRQTLPDWLAPVVTPPPALLSLFSPAGVGASTSPEAGLSLAAAGEVPPVGAGSASATLPDLLTSLVIIIVIGWVGGQLADIDTPESTIANTPRAISRLCRWRGFWGGIAGFVVRSLLLLVNLLPYGCAVIANKFFGHRGGIIHGVLGWFGFSLLIGVIIGTAFWGFLFWIAYGTHLFVDSLSRSGVKLLWPLSNKSLHIIPVRNMQFRTANPLHNAFAQSFFVLLVAWVGYSLGSRIWASSVMPTLTAAVTPSNTLLAGRTSVVRVEEGLSWLAVLPLLGAGIATVGLLVAVWIAAWKAYAQYRLQAATGIGTTDDNSATT